MVTRARTQASELSELLRARRAVAVEWPLIEIAPALDTSALQNAAARLAEFDWVLFSSANGVEQFFRHAKAPLRFTSIGAVGPKTAAALAAKGYRVSAVPAEFLSDALAKTLGDLAGKRVLLVRPEIASPDLCRSLREGGARVEKVIAYRTLLAQEERPFRWQDVDALTLASGSAARGLTAYLRGQRVLDHVCIASIGTSTTKIAEEAGLRIDVEATIHTSEGLVAALSSYFATRKGRT